MKSLQFKPKYYYTLALTLSFIVFGCKALDDWSDLNTVAFFDRKSSYSAENEFKRYSIPQLSTHPLVEYLVDDTNKLSQSYNDQIRKACDYSKLPFNSIPLKEWNVNRIIAPTTRVICIYNTKKLTEESIPKLITFIAEGGTLFIPFASEDHRMAFIYGFKAEAEFDTDSNSSGWYFSSPMLPNLKDKTYSSQIIHFGFAAQNFSNKIKILATSMSNPNYPLVVENRIGKGRVFLYNTSSDFIKSDRGLLFAGVLKGLEGVPYPIANTASIFLDDFPAPLYNTKAEPIASEMNLTMSDFVTKVWWPDMLKLSDEFKIPYTALVTFDYRNKIYPPFTLDQWESQKINTNNKMESLSNWLVRDVSKKGHELAFHGYNHVSLQSFLWKNQDFIGMSLNTVKKKWDLSNFGPLPTSYVPPSNIIDKKGLIALKNAMPNLKYMCSLYLGETIEGGNREFDLDPYTKEFFDYPRISSGFYLTEDEKYNQQSMYLFSGIWTHFVHPDDVFQIASTENNSAGKFDLRNSLNYGWHSTRGKDKSMYGEFKKQIILMTSSFPQMRFLKANDAANIVLNWRASRYMHQSENGIYTVKEINPAKLSSQYWFVYVSLENTDIMDAQLKKQVIKFSRTPFMDGYLYTLYSKESNLALIDFAYKKNNQVVQNLRNTQVVFEEYNKYKEEVKTYLSGGIWIDHTDENFKQELICLKTKILADDTIDTLSWNQYAKYMSWEDRGDEVWKMYEDQIAKNPSAANISYSKELNKWLEYPNEKMKEKWMSEQIKLNPRDKVLLESYISNFYTEDNAAKIKIILKAIYEIDKSNNNYKNYLRHLFQYDTDEAQRELQDKSPTNDLAEFAGNISWMYADKKQFQKAYDWSAYSTDIDFATKMDWLIELKQYKILEKEFLDYSVANPDDYKAKLLMSAAYHEMGNFKSSWMLPLKLSESPEKEELKKMLNQDVIYEDEKIKQDLMANYSELFYPKTLQFLIKENRLNKGNFVDLNSSLETNQANYALLKNGASYNFYDKKNRLQSLAITYSKYYKQMISANYESNHNKNIIGIQYKFKTAEIESKPQYWTRARIEVSKQYDFYYQFGLGYSLSRNKTFKSAELNLFPVETAPGINNKIYQVRFNLYQDFYLLKFINSSISIESNYYSRGFVSTDTINQIRPRDLNSIPLSKYKEALDGSATLRTMVNSGKTRKSKFIPFLEGQISKGSKNFESGFPYWIIRSRLYGGGGLAWQLAFTNFNSKLEASYFFDDYSTEFRRYTGNLSYQLFNYTAVIMNFELFSQSKYYSNSFQMGLKYNFKKKITSKSTSK